MMLRADVAKEQVLDNRVTRAIDRYRYLLFVGVAMLYLLTFNGRWRVGIDSAIYRGLALNLVEGKGFTFGEGMGKRVYPGWPYVLAAVEYVFGPADRTPSDTEQARLLGPSPATTASVLLVEACALLTMVLVYRLVGAHYARWVAVAVACGVGSNSIFLQHSQELLTDVPFLLGLVMSLYGWDLLQRAESTRSRILAMCWIIPGLILTANLRPVFWVLAVSWTAACLWGLYRGPRGFHAVCLGVLVFIGLLRFGLHPFSGGYEMEALDLAPRVTETIGDRLYSALHDQLPASFFGEQLAPASILGSLILLFSSLFLLRRHLLWALIVWTTFAVTLVLSTVPRYYLMILPPLLLGWIFCVCWLARRFSPRWGEVVLVLGLALVTLNNLSRSVRLIVEQRRLDFRMVGKNGHYLPKFADFMELYKGGDYEPTLAWAKTIRHAVRPNQAVLGPWGNILTLLTGRHVYTQRELLPHGKSLHNPFEVKRNNLTFAIFPSDWYRKKDPVIAQLIDRHVIMPHLLIANGPRKSYLATVVVALPLEDWRTISRSWRPPAAVFPLRPAERAARNARKALRAARAAGAAATNPSTQPSTQPASQLQSFRATTTILSPDFDPDNSAELSGSSVYAALDRIFSAARDTSAPGSPWRIESFFHPKYALAAAAASPTDFIEPIAASRSVRGVETFP